MTRALNKLSAAQVKNHGPGKYSDGGGLWLHKRPDGGAQWFLRVVVHGRRREMGLGSLTHVSLKEAREEATKWRTVARKGKDPIKERERLRREAEKADHTLETIAHEAFEARKAELKGDGKAGRWFSPLELHVLPKLGRVPIEELDQRDIKSTLAPIWHTKADTARKAMNRLGIVLRHAAAMGLDVDIQATDKAKALLGKSRHKPKHVPSMDWRDMLPVQMPARALNCRHAFAHLPTRRSWTCGGNRGPIPRTVSFSGHWHGGRLTAPSFLVSPCQKTGFPPHSVAPRPQHPQNSRAMFLCGRG